MLKKENIAILLFARSASEERKHKVLSCSRQKDISLFHQFNQRTEQLIQQTGLPYFISNEAVQQGTSFGEKLTHDILNLFNQGFKKIIIIGNDCPQLHTRHLLIAKNRLEQKDWVIGSNTGGGTYLIGLSKNSFNAKLFINLRWQTRFLYHDLLSTFQLVPDDSLPLFSDVNVFNQLVEILKKLPYKTRLKRIISKLFVNRIIFNLNNSISLSQVRIQAYGLRAPPVFI